MSQSKAQLTNPLGPVNLSGLNATGVITATTFLGDGTALTGIALTGNINTSGIITASSFSGSGTNLTGVQIGATANINTSGIITAASFSGNGVNLTGVGLGPNDSASTTGIVTASKFVGSGIGLTNVGGPIGAVIFSPASGATSVVVGTAITITFSKPIQANSGTITLRSGSASGTIVESFDVTSSNRLTISAAKLTIDPTSDLSEGTVYYVVVPAGTFKDTYVGISSNVLIDNYSFTSQAFNRELWSWGYASSVGRLGLNDTISRSSPRQIPGTQWSSASNSYYSASATKTDGTLWAWGYNAQGQLGQNDRAYRSSPIQIPGTQWSKALSATYHTFATKTDGTLWTIGRNNIGALGQNDLVNRSSPVQVPGTSWTDKITHNRDGMYGIKTDGTLWGWGSNSYGILGLSDAIPRSSPTQIPGTQWSKIGGGPFSMGGIKTDGTLWVWGVNDGGQLGHNDVIPYSSPRQIPGTQWSVYDASGSSDGRTSFAIKTDGTLWAWGYNYRGDLGQNDATTINRSSPRQIPGTQWNAVSANYRFTIATKTDGTLWSWGGQYGGSLGLNDTPNRSSPTQVPGTQWSLENFENQIGPYVFAMKKV